MADITLCTSKTCPKREMCYRATLLSQSLWQSYADFTETCQEDNFSMYWYYGKGER
jgi:hypothetical protein